MGKFQLIPINLPQFSYQSNEESNHNLKILPDLMYRLNNYLPCVLMFPVEIKYIAERKWKIYPIYTSFKHLQICLGFHLNKSKINRTQNMEMGIFGLKPHWAAYYLCAHMPKQFLFKLLYGSNIILFKNCT